VTRYARSWRDGAVRHVQLHRPDRLNAVSDELYADLEEVLHAAVADTEARSLLLSGAGRAFCAGADLKAHAATDRDAAGRRAYVWAGQRVARLLHETAQPVVAAVQGYAIGAGAELALAADVVVCADDAEFRFPEIGLGTFVGGGASYRLPLLVGQQRAKELLLLGRSLSGVEAVGWGLATEAVPGDDVQSRALDIARALGALPPRSVALAKEAMNRAGKASLDEALVFEAEGLLSCMTSDAWSAGVHAFGQRDEGARG
jgi:enoyl-CoA hydratase